jgi:hypothetical protein
MTANSFAQSHEAVLPFLDDIHNQPRHSRLRVCSVFLCTYACLSLTFRRRASGSIEGETARRRGAAGFPIKLVDPGQEIDMVQRVVGAHIECSIVFCLALLARIIAFPAQKRWR